MAFYGAGTVVDHALNIRISISRAPAGDAHVVAPVAGTHHHDRGARVREVDHPGKVRVIDAVLRPFRQPCRARDGLVCRGDVQGIQLCLVGCAHQPRLVRRRRLDRVLHVADRQFPVLCFLADRFLGIFRR